MVTAIYHVLRRFLDDVGAEWIVTRKQLRPRALTDEVLFC